MEPKDWHFEKWPPSPPRGVLQVPNMSPGIKATHLPTGMTATCTECRSQIHNRDECIRQIKARMEAEGVE